MRSLRLLLLLCAAAILSACGATATPANVTVNEPWVRAAVMTGMGSDTSSGHSMSGGDMQPMGGTSAAYMILSNGGGSDDRLIAASTDAAATVEIHESKMVDGVMQMNPVQGGIPVPAGGQAELKPGGLHVMLIGITRDLKEGETVKLTLTFEQAGTIEIDAPVRMP